MEKQISIIIPTYNMEGYIGKCLDSLLIPEFDQVEVLVVNDGSKDRSSEIAHNYADRYPNSIRVIDKPNGNYGSCINAALPQCTGRYVKVLDADDTFDTEAFSQFVRKLSNCNEDVILTSFCYVNSDGKITQTIGTYSQCVKYEKQYLFNDIKSYVFNGYVPMHRLTFRTKLLIEIGYSQTEGISYTDTEWSIIPLSFCESVKFYDFVVYRYLTDREGQTMNPNVINKSLPNFFKILKRLTEFHLNKYNIIPNKDFFLERLLSYHRDTYFHIYNLKNNDAMALLKEYDTELKENNSVIYYAINDIRYDNRVKYKIFYHLRDNKYSTTFKIPFLVRLQLSIQNKIQNIKTHFQ